MKLKTLFSLAGLTLIVLALTNCTKIDGVVVPLSPADSASATVSTLDTGYYEFIAADKNENVYMLKYGGTTIFKRSNTGTKTEFYTIPATADTALRLKCMSIDTLGNLYAISFKRLPSPSSSEVIKISPTGVSGTYISNFDQYTNQGGSRVDKIQVDKSGNIYFNDFGGIHKVTPGGTTSVLKSGQIQSFALDQLGNVIFIILPLDNQLGKITPAGAESVFGGTTQYGSGDGPLSTATFNIMSHIAIDKTGNMFIAEHSGFINQIRVISATRTVSTLISNTDQHLDGNILRAKIYEPQNMITDDNGNIYFTEMSINGTSFIRKITKN